MAQVDLVKKYRALYATLSGPERAWTVINATALEIEQLILGNPAGARFMLNRSLGLL